jgi:hypothetical protein
MTTQPGATEPSRNHHPPATLAHPLIEPEPHPGITIDRAVILACAEPLTPTLLNGGTLGLLHVVRNLIVLGNVRPGIMATGVLSSHTTC